MNRLRSAVDTPPSPAAIPTFRTALAACAGTWLLAASASSQAPPPPDLPFPGMLARSEREAGNPLATYAAMLLRADQYRKSKVFADIFEEVRCNYEQFLGEPLAGQEAMALPQLRGAASTGEVPIPDGFRARPALAVLAEQAARTQLVIFGEEHHLPQTRCLYEPMLRSLWDLGYRYLAAETFGEGVEAADFRSPDYTSGYYLMDPVFAQAVRVARALGYQLVAYESRENGTPGARDRAQAENLRTKIFARDPKAKAVVLCGRGHAAEVAPADGWTPMASVLKTATGIDPFTIFAPTMTERRQREYEAPMYRFATAHGLLDGPTMFVEDGGATLGSGNFDAYLFLPRVQLIDGRPDWMHTVLGRRSTAVPEQLVGGKGLRLVQAFAEGDPPTAVPVDQILLRDAAPLPHLMLPAGTFRVRVVDGNGGVVGPVSVTVGEPK
jgi:hypothetical protein